MQIDRNLNVVINIVCVVTDIADRQDTLISCIEYVIIEEIPFCRFTAIKVKYVLVVHYMVLP